MTSEVWLAAPAEFWGLMIGLYLFLGGVAGGSYVTAFSADLLAYRNGESETAHRQSVRWGLSVAVLGMVIAGPVLLLHLGAPLRALLLYSFTNVTSWMAIGVWIIVLFTVLALVQLLWVTFGEWATTDRSAILRSVAARIGVANALDGLADRSRPSPRVRLGLNGFGAALAVLLVVYTALLLSAAWVVPAWHPTLLPLLFLASGLSMGIAATIGLTIFSAGVDRAPVHGYSLADDVLIVAELLLLYLLWQHLATAGTPATEATIAVLATNLQWAFFGVVIGLGLIAPLVLSLILFGLTRVRDERSVRHLLRAGFTMKFGFVVLGGFALRLVVLFAAVQEPILI